MLELSIRSPMEYKSNKIFVALEFREHSSLPNCIARISSLFQPQRLSVRLYLYYNILHHNPSRRYLSVFYSAGVSKENQNQLRIEYALYLKSRHKFFIGFGFV